jgi:hypothetical protein
LTLTKGHRRQSRGGARQQDRQEKTDRRKELGHGLFIGEP